MEHEDFDLHRPFVYALDANGNLVTGNELHFVYSGAGVATFTYADGTGVKIKEGTRNLVAVVDGDVILGDELPSPLDDEITPEEASEAGHILSTSEQVASEAAKTLQAYKEQEEEKELDEAIGPVDYSSMTNKELRAILDEAGIKYAPNAVKAVLLDLVSRI